jgi:hypothetical protein
LGSLLPESQKASGKPAFGSWPVRATAMTVPDRSLKTSWLKTNTGRSPDCPWPIGVLIYKFRAASAFYINVFYKGESA